jgi:hypothetical protein
MKKTDELEKLQRRHKQLLEQLGRTRFVLQGTIQTRTMRRKARGKLKTYGPYYEWTWKRKAKTVTVSLTASQAKRYQKAIDNHRRMESLLNELRQVSLQILEATTTGVKRRKRTANPDLGQS